MNNVYISSFYKSNISPYLLFYQKQVFRMFGIELHQICNNDISHGDFLNKILREVTADYFIFFDVDCIPTSSETIDKIFEQVSDNKTVAGCAQTANQFKDGRNLYVGPFFFAISKEVYLKMGSPDLNTNNDKEVDVGGMITKLAPQFGIELEYWYPTDVEVEKWPLYPNKFFGIGTTYENLVYHLFESRYSQNIVRFIRKSKTTINKNWKLNPLTYIMIILNIQLFKLKMRT